jgi:hypothetical protein
MSRTTSRLHSLALFCLLLLAFSLPFEPERPLLNLGLIQFTNVELVLLGTLGLVALLVVTERRWRQRNWLAFPTAWLVLGAGFALALLLAGLFAPDFRANALKAAFRGWTGLALALAVPQVVRDPRSQRLVFVALVGSGLLAILLGLVEMTLDRPLALLTIFREAPTSAGPFMRLTGSFAHANQTAMYIEGTLPLLVALLVWLYQWARPKTGVVAYLPILGIAAFFVYLEAAFLTYSRSSFVTIFLSSLLTAGLLWWRRPGRRPAYLWAGVAAAIIPLAVVNTGASDAFQMRLSSEGDNEWYEARLEVPADLSIRAGETHTVTVGIANEGSLFWSSEGDPPIYLAGRWYRQPENARLRGEMRWSLEETLAPGDSLTQPVGLRAPNAPGDYRFEWDLLQENVVWFSVKNGLRTSSDVTVLPNPEGTGGPVETTDPTDPGTTAQIPDRRTLWRAAGQLLLAHPLLGIGQDNFRLMYGRVLGWTVWNDTIHTNNWYIESIVSLGLIGSMPFLVWLGLLAADLIQKLRQLTVSVERAALAAGLFAFLIHGLLDYFLAFNATALLFWLLVGLWVSQMRQEWL